MPARRLRSSPTRGTASAALALVLAIGLLATPAAARAIGPLATPTAESLAAAVTPAPRARPGRELPLGPRGLGERRSTTAVGPWVSWTRIVRGQRPHRPGPWLVNVLAVDRRALAGRLSAVLSNETVVGLETVSSMARRTGALAGVNGDYYVTAGAGAGDPPGVLALRGELISESTDGRTALLIPRSPRTRATLAGLSFDGSVEIDGRRRMLDGVNRVRGSIPNCGGRGGDRPTERPRLGGSCTDPSELVMLSPRFGAQTPPAGGGVEAVVEGGVVTSVREGGGTPIPSDGYVLSGSEDAADFLLSAARPRSRPRVSAGLRAGRRPLSLPNYEAIISGGPSLVSRGRVAVSAAAEGFDWNRGLRGHFVAGRNPRTMAGVTADGRVLLVTVDGRRPGISVGVSLAEGARVMASLGAREAMNLDGGGSTTMAIGARVVNRVSDRTGERPVAVGIFVLP